MRILIALTYYHPYKSGLTVYAVRLAQALAKKGHTVKVLTSYYDKNLPQHEFIDGVEVIRVPVLFRVSKGVIMPSMPIKAWRLIRESDVINLHLPQVDAAYLSVISRILGKPIVLTYQCDLVLPPGVMNWIANRVSYLADRISAGMAQTIVSLSQDYAENSLFLPDYFHKVKVVRAPISLPSITSDELASFKEKHQISPDQKVIGIYTRLAAEKGVEYLVNAMPVVLEKYPQARVLAFGQYQNVICHRSRCLFSHLRFDCAHQCEQH
jgi:glycosyltransferase involved in cell wall biosynthesis